MRLSEITAAKVQIHARVEGDDMQLVPDFIEAAQSYILGQTGLTSAEADEYPELAIAALSIIADMLDNRSIMLDSSSGSIQNKTAESILRMHCRNLVAGGSDG